MVNLIAGEEVVPELVQHDFTADKVASCIETILADGPARQHMLEGLAQVRIKLRGTTNDTPATHPADRAAQIILTLNAPDASIPLRQ
jgi:lipid-A-disaccharide synthase